MKEFFETAVFVFLCSMLVGRIYSHRMARDKLRVCYSGQLICVYCLIHTLPPLQCCLSILRVLFLLWCRRDICLWSGINAHSHLFYENGCSLLEISSFQPIHVFNSLRAVILRIFFKFFFFFFF